MDLLEDTALSLRAIGKTTSPEVLERIRLRSTDFEKILVHVVELLPTVVGRSIAHVLLELADEPMPASTSAAVRYMARPLSDLRTFRDAADQIDSLVERARTFPDDLRAQFELAVKHWGTETIPVPLLRKLSVLLLSMGRRGEEAIQWDESSLSVADSSMSLTDLVVLAGELEDARRIDATASVLRGRPEGAHVEPPTFGAEDPLWMLEERQLVMLPSRSTEKRLITVDPLPKELRATTTVLEKMRQHVRIDVPDTLDERTEEEILRVIYVSLHVGSVVLQHPFFSTLDSLQISVVDDPVSVARYFPDGDLIEVTTGPVGPFLLVHELGHAVDHRLGSSTDNGGFRSEQKGTPIYAFTEAARPLYRPVIDKRVDRYVRLLLDRALTEPLGAEPVLLSDLVGRLAFMPPEHGAELERDIIDGWWAPSNRTNRTVMPARYRGGVAVLEAISGALDVDGDSITVNPTALVAALGVSERERLLSGPEIFARFFDQYARLLFRQRGTPFGPAVMPSDLDMRSMKRLAKPFLDMLAEEQYAHLGRRSSVRTVGKLDSGFAAVATSLSLGALAFLFPEGGR